ncbi:tripartite tricarboxylate transporter substrate-binding protein [Pelagibacteraceae bacterium]|jgi:putative tricarboxylic transport membrane protein|uniref:Bug family tripartite tricarboxylate transporter substrate binding protein n=1 Tax=Pelagibacter sp. (strain IMCC9063) TaxID=1002672 RepID=UPI0002046642|nr:tripartite tricarboxylate transporter substrate-binding protein [Candidatus Pelagibacter sp. IMCC9063]AEA81344.1 putative exported protein [Candidatus Pelagibacter sp. IMCC9063]MDB4022864.1 tripartite tricarboxylate transporter substrate-binding protein [Pelagibacteraceae bacterium]MDB9712014.1 tripartite tricarboxylate transporter substrate-binding protein [Pelagibacteraceae bacterium]|tara:strand:+ start:457 stop:1431 length:975 start_codon:yes stop_codon:yes gene_type:complete
MKNLIKIVSLFTLSFFILGNQAFAEFPEKEIKVIVNYGAGGGVDRTARSLQKFLPKAFGKTVIVENHKGAGGKIGLKKFMAEPRDGYSILTAFAPATTYVKFKDSKVFKTDDLDIINIQWVDPAIIYARKDTGWKNIDDMIKAVKANPGKYSFGSSGKGSVGPVLSRVLFKELGLDVKMVPYKGGGKTRKAFIAGEVHMSAAGSGGALKAKKHAVVLGAFMKGSVPGWDKAQPINKLLKKYGYKVKVPYGGAYRFHALHKDVKKNYPKRYKKIISAYKKTTKSNKDFIAFADKTKVGRDWLGPRKSNKLYRKVDKEFTDIMSKY